MLHKWVALRPNERALLAAGVLWVLAAHAVLRTPFTSLPTKQRALDVLGKRLLRLPRCSLADAKWAVTAAGKRVPGTVCLPWALALRGLLAQAGIAAELRIGVAADGDALKAHAWLECGDETLTWNEPVEPYSVLRSRVEPS